MAWLTSSVAACAIGPHRPGAISPAGASLPPGPVWRTDIPSQGVPAVDRTAVYAMGPRREILAVDRQTGRPRWRHAIAGSPGTTQAFRIVPVASDRLLAGDYDVVAVRRSNGRVLWRFSPDDGGYGPGMYLGACDDRQVYAGSPSGRLYAIDHQKGSSTWTLEIEAPRPTTIFAPVLSGAAVVAGYTTFSAPIRGGLLAVDRSTGTRLWQTPFPLPDGRPVGTGWSGGPVVLGDRVAAASGNGWLHAMDISTGRIAWSLPAVPTNLPEMAGDPARDFRALTTSGRTLVAASLTGYVTAWDLATGGERWHRTPAEGSAAFQLAADESRVYVPFQSGRLTAFDVATGDPVWQAGTPAGPRFVWPPAIDAGMLYLASSAGLWAFDAPRSHPTSGLSGPSVPELW